MKQSQKEKFRKELTEPHYRETANALIEAGFLEFNGKLTQKCYE